MPCAPLDFLVRHDGPVVMMGVDLTRLSASRLQEVRRRIARLVGEPQR